MPHAFEIKDHRLLFEEEAQELEQQLEVDQDVNTDDEGDSSQDTVQRALNKSENFAQLQIRERKTKEAKTFREL